MRNLRNSPIAGSKIFRSAQPKTGFTLIEVLVVVAIIALLVSILLPSLSRAREQAKITSCLANLHDLGTSLQQYANSNDPYFPLPIYIGTGYSARSRPAVAAASDDNMFVLWYFKYAKNINSWTCPATTHKMRTPVVRKPQSTVSSGPINGLPQRTFTTWELSTPGSAIADRSDFREIAQTRRISATQGNQEPGFGTSYEYHGWSICAMAKGATTILNWYHDGYGTKIDGAPMTTRIGRPVPQYAILMHDADDANAIGAPGGVSQNNTPEPWDNHGNKGMNFLFVDGHSTMVRSGEIKPGYTYIDQTMVTRSDCGFQPP